MVGFKGIKFFWRPSLRPLFFKSQNPTKARFPSSEFWVGRETEWVERRPMSDLKRGKHVIYLR